MDESASLRADAERCLSVFRHLGFSHYGKPSQEEFEGYLASTRKVVVVHGRILAEIGDIQFYDDPQGDRTVEPGVALGARKFRWAHRFLRITGEVPLGEELVRSLTTDGLYEGFPHGPSHGRRGTQEPDGVPRRTTAGAVRTGGPGRRRRSARIRYRKRASCLPERRGVP